MQTFSSMKGMPVALAAAVVTVTTSALPTAMNPPDPGLRWVYVGCMALFGVLMVLSMRPGCDEAVYNSRAGWLYFGGQVLLLGLADGVGRGQGITWVASMPLLGQAASIRLHEGGFRAAAFWVAVLFVVVCAGKVLGFGWGGFLFWVGPITGCFLFVLAFTWMTTEAVERKREVESLMERLAKANHLLTEQSERIDSLSRESERARVARELHDSLGHGLTALAVQLEVLEALPDRNSPRAAQAVERARLLAQGALKDVRESVRTLRTPAVTRALEERLEELVSWEEGGGVAATFRALGAPAPLPPDKEQSLYRAAQEGLTNARKHSAATQVEVTLDRRQPDRVRLEVRDNGRGLAAEAEDHRGGGFGIAGLRERFGAWGGTVNATRLSDGGFLLAVEMPR